MRWQMYCVLLYFLPSVLSISFNEIMYNPIGPDNNLEYLELYDSNGIGDLTGYIIGDRVSNDSLVLLTNYSAGNYALITESGYDVSMINVTVYSAGATIGNNLNNDEDDLFLYDFQKIVSYAYYNSSMGGAGDGTSLEFINGTFISGAIGGSPGRENNVTAAVVPTRGVSLSVNVKEPIYSYVTYDKLFTVTNLQPSFGHVSVNATYWYANTTDVFSKSNINQYSTTGTGQLRVTDALPVRLCGNITSSDPPDEDYSDNVACTTLAVIDSLSIPCEVNISVMTSRQLYYTNESVYFDFHLTNTTFPYSLSYWWDDVFGLRIKNTVTTENLHSKSYKPSLKESDKAYYINAALDFIACNNSGEILSDRQLVVVRTVDGGVSQSSLRIEKVYAGTDDRVKFGETFRIRLEVYKGNTTKSVVKGYVEDPSGIPLTTQQSQLTLNGQFQQFDVTIPLHLKPNCNNAFSDGIYTIVVEGLGTSYRSPVTVRGGLSSVCDTTTIVQTRTEKVRKRFDVGVMVYPDIVMPGEKFSVDVELSNNQDTDVDVRTWSYVYRGSKSYSGDREIGSQQFILSAGERRVVSLANTVDRDAKVGDYKLKVLVNKDNQKTNTEIVKTLRVQEPIFSDTQLYFDSNPSTTEVGRLAGGPVVVHTPKIAGAVLYESISQWQVKMVPYLLTVLVVVLIVLVVRGGLA